MNDRSQHTLIPQVWIVEFSRGNGNNAFFLHRRGTFPPALLFRQQPGLGNFTLADTHPVVITARDGLKVPGYLTLPALPGLPKQLPAGLAGDLPDPQSFNALLGKGSKPQAVQRLQGSVKKVDWNLPMVLLVHGGPWKRATWGSSAGITQWLANRGYVVLNVNFRASIGYGKKFTHKGEVTGVAMCGGSFLVVSNCANTGMISLCICCFHAAAALGSLVAAESKAQLPTCVYATVTHIMS